MTFPFPAVPPLHRFTNPAAFVLVALLISGCAIDNDIRMTPTTSVNATRINDPTQPVQSSPSGLVLYNVSPSGDFSRVPDVSALNPDLYVTVDISSAINATLTGKMDQTTRNTIVGFLIYLSDRNADLWENRVYARYKLRTGVIGLTRDISTAGAGASALIVPPIAAGLSAFNLFAGSASDQIDTTLYSKDTVETLIKGITAARRTYKGTIRTNLSESYDKYDMFTALDQVRHYDSLVSFRKGLAYLANMADSQTQKADAQLDNTAASSAKPKAEAANAAAAANALQPAQP